RHRQNSGERVCDTLPCNVGSRTVTWLVHTATVFIQRGRGQHTYRTCQHSSCVGQNITKHIASHQHIELFWCTDQLHRCIVYIHVRQLNVRILFVQSIHYFTPQHSRF